ncbi:MAG: hypothetical protein WEA75_09280 [Acidimicrobiia bacterium]
MLIYAIGMVILLAFVALFLFSFGSDPLGLSGGGSGHFPNALTWASPDPWAGDRFRGYEWATASELERIDQTKGFGHEVTFVPADKASTGNLVVSVNPIDHFTWSAVAKVSNDRCYALIVVHNRNDPELGSERYARFAPGAPCRAELATRETVRRAHAPQ